MNRNLYLKLWGAAMMQIIQEDLNRYFEAQKIKTATCKLSGKSYDKETTNLFKRIENLEKLLDGANVKEG